MKKLVIIALFLLNVGVTMAQSVEKKGNVFVQVKDTTYINSGVKTEYKYQDSKGVEYPIYLTKNGKAFIIRVSKKTGRPYRYYLPKVTEQLGK